MEGVRRMEAGAAAGDPNSIDGEGMEKDDGDGDEKDMGVGEAPYGKERALGDGDEAGPP